MKSVLTLANASNIVALTSLVKSMRSALAYRLAELEAAEKEFITALEKRHVQPEQTAKKGFTASVITKSSIHPNWKIECQALASQLHLDFPLLESQLRMRTKPCVKKHLVITLCPPKPPTAMDPWSTPTNPTPEQHANLATLLSPPLALDPEQPHSNLS